MSSVEDDYTQLYIGTAMLTVTTAYLARGYIVSGAKATARFSGRVAGAVSHCFRTRLRVTGIAPAHGPAAGLTNVRITGTGFLAGATVTIGSPATNVVFVDAQTIDARTALTGAGPAGVTVTNNNGDTDTLINGYTYDAAPTVTGIAPPAGPSDGGQPVLITGTGFMANPTVTVGGAIAGGSVAFVDAQNINARTAPHGVGGPVDVVVTNTDGQRSNAYAGYTYNAPAVTAVRPNGGTTVGATAVTITGTDFVNGAAVTFDGQAAGNIVVVNATTITATTPPHVSGPVDVRVTNPANDHGTLVRGYRYRLPTLNVVDPAEGPYYGGTDIRLTGTNFAANPAVALGANAANNVALVDAQTITARTQPGAGTVNVTVTNTDGNATNPVLVQFRFLPLAITGLSVNRGTSRGGTDLTITGTSFNAGATVTIGGRAAGNVVRNSATEIACTTPANPHGTETVDVVVTNPDGQTATRQAGFTYFAPPSVVCVTPNSGLHEGGSRVTIRGADFSNNVTVRFDGREADNVARLNAHTIRADTPEGPAGRIDVQVVNSDGQEVTLAAAFTYDPAPPPRNVVIYPGDHDRTTLDAEGGNDGTVPAALNRLHNDGELDAQHTAAAAQAVGVAYHRHIAAGVGGMLFVRHQHTRHGDEHNVHQVLDVTMHRPANNYTANLINIPSNGMWLRGQIAGHVHAPQVAAHFADAQEVQTAIDNALAFTSISHSTGPLNGGWTVDLIGANLPAANFTVEFGAGNASPVVNQINAQLIQAEVPAGAGAGAVHVRITDADGVYVELQNAFTYQALTVVAIARTNGPQAGGETVEISGTGFQTDATVDIDNNALGNIVVNGPTSITGEIPQGAAAAAVHVTVTNPIAAGNHVQALNNGYTYY